MPSSSVTTPTKRIDYLYLAGAECVSARVLPGDASDHRALLVKLRLAGRRVAMLR